MDYAKDEIFHIRYNSQVNRLQIPKEKWTSKWAKKIKKNKWISLIIALFLLFSCFNFFFIYQFMQILQQGILK